MNQRPIATLRLLPEHAAPHMRGIFDELKDVLIASYSGVRIEEIGYIEIQIPEREQIRIHNIRRSECLPHMQSIARAFLLGYQHGVFRDFDKSLPNNSITTNGNI